MDDQNQISRFFHIAILSRNGIHHAELLIPEGIEKKDLPAPDKLLQDKTSLRLSRLSREWVAMVPTFGETMPRIARLARFVAARRATSAVQNHAKERGRELEGCEYNSIKIPEGQVQAVYELPFGDLPIVRAVQTRSNHNIRGYNRLGIAFVSALMSEYEALLRTLLRLVSEKSPGAFLSEDATIPLSALSRYSTWEEAREDQIVHAIDDLIQEKSHLELLSWAEKKFSVNLTSDPDLMKKFSEICFRRNLFVHGKGEVNARYLRGCIAAGLDEDSLPKIGERLTADNEYLMRSAGVLFKVGFFSLHVLWQKLFPEIVSDSVSDIVNASHALLQSDQFVLAGEVADFALKSKTKIHTLSRVSLVINKAQASLFGNDDPEVGRKAVEGVLAEYDWSMVTPKVQLLLACLRRDFSNLSDLTQRAMMDDLTFYEAQTWSVFREVRSRSEFASCFPEFGPLRLDGAL